jgi:ribose transport system permease protein
MFARFLPQNSSRAYLAQCLLFLVVLGVVFSLTSPFFLSLPNINNVLIASAVLGLIALGATFVIASGGIDLSSAAVMALSSVVSAYFLQQTQMPPVVALALGVSAGGVCGFLTGFFINITKAPSFIVSLGMLSVARAAAYIISGGVPIYGLPEGLIIAGQGSVAGLPVPIFVLLAGIAGAVILLTLTRFGAHTLLYGDNPAAAEAMGVPTAFLRLKVFTLAGLYSGLAGLIFTLRTNSGDPSAGQNYELIGITAVILGGASLFGGRATIFGTVLGVLCLGVLQNGLNLLAVSTYYQTLFVGIVLIAAAFLSRAGQQR